jgi:DNA-binding transcriptional MerR regulator
MMAQTLQYWHFTHLVSKKQQGKENQREESQKLGTRFQVILSFLNEGICLQCL